MYQEKKKPGAQNIVKEIKQYEKKWLQHVQRMDTNRLPKQALQHVRINQKNEGTQNDRGRDGGTNFILRIKEQETRLTLEEHDDDGDDEYWYIVCERNLIKEIQGHRKRWTEFETTIT